MIYKLYLNWLRLPKKRKLLPHKMEILINTQYLVSIKLIFFIYVLPYGIWIDNKIYQFLIIFKVLIIDFMLFSKYTILICGILQF